MLPAGCVSVSSDLIPERMRGFLINILSTEGINSDYTAIVNGHLIFCILVEGTLTCYKENKCCIVKKRCKQTIYSSKFEVSKLKSENLSIPDHNIFSKRNIEIKPLVHEKNTADIECRESNRFISTFDCLSDSRDEFDPTYRDKTLPLEYHSGKSDYSSPHLQSNPLTLDIHAYNSYQSESMNYFDNLIGMWLILILHHLDVVLRPISRYKISDTRLSNSKQ